MAQDVFHRTFVLREIYDGYIEAGGSGSVACLSQEEAFGAVVAHMNEHNLWGAYPGYARSPWAAMYSYTKMHGGSGRVTASMWNGYMQTKWAGYAYDLSTISKTSSKSGVGFQTIGSTYENLNLGGVVATFFTYSKAESMFLGGQQSSGNWYSPAGQSNWGLSAVALGLEHTPGSFRLGTTKLGFSPKYYGNAWRGNQYAKTFNIGKIGKGLGIAGAAVGVIADGVGLRTYYNDPNSLNAISPGKFGLNLGMTGLGFTGIGTVPSVLYFGVDAFYPGGWEGYIRDDVTNWTNMRYECNCDPSVGLYLP